MSIKASSSEGSLSVGNNRKLKFREKCSECPKKREKKQKIWTSSSRTQKSIKIGYRARPLDNLGLSWSEKSYRSRNLWRSLSRQEAVKCTRHIVKMQVMIHSYARLLLIMREKCSTIKQRLLKPQELSVAIHLQKYKYSIPSICLLQMRRHLSGRLERWSKW